MTDKYLVVRGDTVENLIVFSGGQWAPPAGTTLLAAEGELASVSVGWKFVDDRWMPPQPYPSWTFDENSFEWQAPVPYPSERALYSWDETAGEWVPSPTIGAQE